MSVRRAVVSILAASCFLLGGCERSGSESGEAEAEQESAASSETPAESAGEGSAGEERDESDDREPTAEETVDYPELLGVYQRLKKRYRQQGGAEAMPPRLRGMPERVRRFGRMMERGDAEESDDGTDAAPLPGGLGRGMSWARANAMDSWHRQMAVWHRQMHQQHTAEGEAELAKMHEELAARHDRMGEAFEAAAEEMKAEKPSEEEDKEEDGEARAREHRETLYLSACATCHGEEGQGVTGAFPPLAGAELVTGAPDRLIRVVLHGMEGPVDVGKRTYDGVMPAFRGRYTRGELADLMTYIREAWGNEAEPVTVEQIEAVQKKYEGHAGPWTAQELGLSGK